MSDELPRSGQPDPGEARLLERLRKLAQQLDPVPQSVLSAARASLTWRTIDAELAELVYDSALDEARLVTVRGADGPRLLTFESPEITVDVEVSTVSGRLTLVGHVIPPGPTTIEVHHRDGALSVESDDRGRFLVEGVSTGPVRLLCRVVGGTESALVETDWITL
jgi:hypothetical protein